ncbi:PAS domain-containing methyl-accepting chemotaxis protein [Thalassotalea sp. G2M2-11]|uniref:methyl-accepting chemotaxis protein n=1 Tax=Thalassotalea sp. G2M2-11 TaxID=2787627 RepID=UPI0019D11298|nr:PAS domain-containing methyl-accepting chemotaxis protein [Thalassotalea sp. G2M2-11]
MKKNNKVTGVERLFTSSMLLSTTDTKGRVTYANQDFCEIAGYEKEELVGHGHNIVRHPEMPSAAFENLWDTIAAGESWMGPVKNRCKNGDHYWVNAYVTPIKDANGTIYEYQSVRTKPEAEVVDRAEKTYQQINQGKLPLALKFTQFDITRYIQFLLFFICLMLVIASVTLSLPIIFSLPAVSIVLITTLLFFGWRKRYIAVVTQAEKVFNNPLMSHVYSGHPDKLGRIQLAMTMRQAELNAIIGRVRDLSEQVKSLADDCATNGEDISHMLTEQNDEIAQVATAMAQMTTTVQELATLVTEAADASVQGTEQSKNGLSVVEQTVEAIDQMSAQLKNVDVVIRQLVEGSGAIEKISDEINSIADQTNLLALNAAIEAARAGEHGRGFAVVAEEVRALAQRTQQSTEEIKTTLGKINQESMTAFDEMRKGAEHAENCVEFANNTGDALSKVSAEVEHISQLNMQISTAVEEQSVVTEQVSGNTNRIKDIATSGVSRGDDAKKLSADLLTELNTLHSLIEQFKH